MGGHEAGIETSRSGRVKTAVGKKFARVALEGGLKKRLVYAIPDHLQKELDKGHKVAVPLGKSNRKAWGYIIEFVDSPNYDLSKIKEIISGPPNKLQIPDELMRLAHWVSDYYCTPIGTVLMTMLPAAVRRPQATHKFVNCVRRNATLAEVRKACVELRTRAPKQAEVLEAMLKKHGDVVVSELCKETSTNAATVGALEKKGLLKIEKKQQHRDFLKEDVFIKVDPKKLNTEQQQVFDRLCEVVDNSKFHVDLLHGITGSGKTEIYLQLIAHARKKGKSAIVLVPEIALTPQTIEHFRSRFDEKIAVLHSRLSAGERHDEWHRILSGEAAIVIGPRSAVFAPVKEELGVIVVDEEHDGSYKQQEMMPLYNARDVAVVRAKFQNALVVLGSATPSMESYHNSLGNKYTLSVLPGRVFARPLPEVKIIDMRREQSENNKYVIISQPLLDAVETRIKTGEQAILFLNRRGYATFAICTSCGEVIKCDHCSISMKYHRAEGLLKCHLCGDTKLLNPVCGKCGQPDVKYRGIGTQQIENLLNRILPDARVLRMDFDTTQKKHSHGNMLNEFRRGKANILLGTQMIAKGLDFPNVTLVGILNADVSLNLQDFRAAEHTFQIVTQVAGRAGRGEVPGEVFIQTYNPEHPAIIAASQQDYVKFFNQEYVFRSELAYPPLTHLVKILMQGEKEEDVRKSADLAAGQLRHNLPSTVELLGPVEAPVSRIKGRHRYQIFLKSQNIRGLIKHVKDAMKELKCKASIRITIDVDPISLL
jgi:primosomal protein N' (replication factor Y) (superfamily II helicase)